MYVRDLKSCEWNVYQFTNIKYDLLVVLIHVKNYITFLYEKNENYPNHSLSFHADGVYVDVFSYVHCNRGAFITLSS